MHSYVWHTDLLDAQPRLTHIAQNRYKEEEQDYTFQIEETKPARILHLQVMVLETGHNHCSLA